MAQQTRNNVKSNFQAGDKPTEAQFSEAFDSSVFIRDEKIVGSVDSISDLIGVATTNFPDGLAIHVKDYYPSSSGGGGIFYWDSSESQTNHNGGTIIDPDHTQTIGSSAWYSSENSGNGCWKRPIGDSISFLEFGPNADGNTDDGPIFQNAINASQNEEVPLVVPYDSSGYYINTSSSIDLSKPFKLEGKSQPLILAESKWLDTTTSNTESLTLDADGTRGDYQITVTDTSAANKGEMLYISSDKEVCAGPWPEDARELFVIAEVVDSTTLRLSHPLTFDYDISVDTISITVYQDAGRVDIDNFELKHQGSYSDYIINISSAQNPKVENIKIRNDSLNETNDCLSFSTSIEPVIKNIRGEGIRYGVFISNAVRGANISNITGHHSRHLTIVGELAQDTLVSDVTGYYNNSTVDTHAAINTKYNNIVTWQDDNTSGFRGIGGSVENSRFNDMQDSTSSGYIYINNADFDEALSKEYPFTMNNVVMTGANPRIWFQQEGDVKISNFETDILFIFEDTSSTPEPDVQISNSTITRTRFRQNILHCDNVIFEHEGNDLALDLAGHGGVHLHNCEISDFPYVCNILNGQTNDHKFVGCTFNGMDNFIDAGNSVNDEIEFTFIGCTFNNFTNSFDTTRIKHGDINVSENKFVSMPDTLLKINMGADSLDADNSTGYFNIAHGLVSTPDFASIQVTDENSVIAKVVSLDSTNVTGQYYDTSDGSNDTGAYNFVWKAEVK